MLLPARLHDHKTAVGKGWAKSSARRHGSDRRSVRGPKSLVFAKRQPHAHDQSRHGRNAGRCLAMCVGVNEWPQPPGRPQGGCPHPAAPRGARRRFLMLPMCGGRERPPYRAGQTRRPTGKMPPPCSNPLFGSMLALRAGALRRPLGRRRFRPESSREPGRPERRAPVNPPTTTGRPAANRENAPRRAANLCRGRFHIGPGPRRIARLAGGACPSPTNHGKRPTKRDGLKHPGGRRAGCPHPAAPRAAANTRGRIGNPPLRPAAVCRIQTNKQKPAARAGLPVLFAGWP